MRAKSDQSGISNACLWLHDVEDVVKKFVMQYKKTLKQEFQKLIEKKF